MSTFGRRTTRRGIVRRLPSPRLTPDQVLDHVLQLGVFLERWAFTDPAPAPGNLMREPLLLQEVLGEDQDAFAREHGPGDLAPVQHPRNGEEVGFQVRKVCLEVRPRSHERGELIGCQYLPTPGKLGVDLLCLDLSRLSSGIVRSARAWIT